MKLGLYCVARYKRADEGSDREFVEYGIPFVEVDDDSARFAVREAVKDVKDKIDLSLFSVVKVGAFSPDDVSEPIEGRYSVETVVEDCLALFEVKVNE